MDEAAARAAAEQIQRIAEDHAGLLSGYASRVLAGLHGPGGRRAADEARERTAVLHRAFMTAWNSAAAGTGTPLMPPGLAPFRAVEPAGWGSRRQVDEAALNAAQAEAKRSGWALRDAGSRLAGVLSGAGLDTAPAFAVQATGDWLLEQPPRLRNRIDRALAADAAVADVFDPITGGTAVAGQLDTLPAGDLTALAALARLQRLPPSRDRATQAYAWWTTLPEATRARLKALIPRTLGGLDGIPARDRDMCNRVVLGAEIAHLEGRLRETPQFTENTYQGGLRMPNPEYAQVREMLANLTGLRGRLDADGVPPVLLLGFGTDGPGKVIVSFDDPDTADNVVTFVPGFGTNQGGIQGNLARVERTAEWANLYAPGQSTAAIYWFDYRPPQVGPSAPRALDPGRAFGAQEPLGGFMRGLEAAHQGDTPAHTTIVGHSYGSTATGKTALAYPGIANNLVFIGSPGAGVSHASQLGVDPTHVWASEALDDAIPQFPRPAGDNVPVDPSQGILGTKPTHPDFGGGTFYSAPGGHSGYWDPDSPSLKNMAHIAVGQAPSETR